MAVEALTEPPSMAALLVRAVATARGRRGDVIPDRTLRLADFVIDRERLAAYQRLTGHDVDDALPQTYPWVLAFPVQTALMARDDFPLALPGMVHLENAITTHRRLDAAEPLTLDVTAGAIRPHRRGRTLDVRMEARVGRELVWECDSVYLSRGNGSEGAPRGERPPPAPAGSAVARWSLPSGLGREYAGVSGDVNPIHLHPLTARAMGFKRHMAHGMWTSARTLAALGRGSLGPSRSRVWFTAPVYLPGRVELVREQRGGVVTAALRDARNPTTTHLVMTLESTAARR